MTHIGFAAVSGLLIGVIGSQWGLSLPVTMALAVTNGFLVGMMSDK